MKDGAVSLYEEGERGERSSRAEKGDRERERKNLRLLGDDLAD